MIFGKPYHVVVEYESGRLEFESAHDTITEARTAMETGVLIEGMSGFILYNVDEKGVHYEVH